MNKSIRAGLSIGLAITTLGFITLAAQAAGTSNCQVIYGGGEVCDENIKYSIDKLVKNTSGTFVDNLNTNDSKYSASQNVEFKIIIQNTGNTRINSIKVEDTLPQYLEYVSGAGNYDANSRTLTFIVTNLDAGKKAEYTISTKVVENASLPQDKGTICVINNVKAIESRGNTAQDSSQVCIERIITKKPTPQVFEATPVKKIPETGPEMLPLLGLIPAGIAGFAMRRKFKLS